MPNPSLELTSNSVVRQLSRPASHFGLASRRTTLLAAAQFPRKAPWYCTMSRSVKPTWRSVLRVKVPLCLMALPIAIAGCASRYQAPAGIDRAVLVTNVEYREKGIGTVSLQNFADEACTKSPQGTRIAAYVSSGRLAPLRGFETPIVANKPFVFTFLYSIGVETVGGQTSCRVTTSFTPKPGRRYRTDFVLLRDSCKVDLVEVNAATSQEQPVPDARQLQHACFDVGLGAK